MGTRHEQAALTRSPSSSTELFAVDGQLVRDLNGNGKLDVYEDPGAQVEERIDDLLQQMTAAGIRTILNPIAAVQSTDDNPQRAASR